MEFIGYTLIGYILGFFTAFLTARLLLREARIEYEAYLTWQSRSFEWQRRCEQAERDLKNSQNFHL